eukprot:6297783-Alexandrium_andersonii.AAC.1
MLGRTGPLPGRPRPGPVPAPPERREGPGGTPRWHQPCQGTGPLVARATIAPLRSPTRARLGLDVAVVCEVPDPCPAVPGRA